jgi:hypothetical protein
MSAIQNLIKAHKAKAVTQDTYTLQKYLAKFEGENGAPKEKAHMVLKGLEAKYIPSFDKNSPSWNGQSQGNGFRTRFILEDGSTVGSFSNGAYQFFVFFAQLMGYEGSETFLHIDINGQVKVEISTVPLDGGRSTYNFELLEEGSELNGFSDYLPTTENILSLDAPTAPEAPAEEADHADTEEGEPEAQPETEQPKRGRPAKA